MAMETLEEKRLSTEELSELWGQEVPCGHIEHGETIYTHSEGPATFRGYAPCGYNLHICERYAAFLRAVGGWIRLKCAHCGDAHPCSEIRLVEI